MGCCLGFIVESCWEGDKPSVRKNHIGPVQAMQPFFAHFAKVFITSVRKSCVDRFQRKNCGSVLNHRDTEGTEIKRVERPAGTY